MSLSVMLYSKRIQTKSGKAFTKYLVSYNHKSYDCNITKEFLTKNKDYMEWRLPQEITLADDDYFIKAEYYMDKEGQKQTKYKIVLLDCDSHKEAKFEKLTLDQIAK